MGSEHVVEARAAGRAGDGPHLFSHDRIEKRPTNDLERRPFRHRQHINLERAVLALLLLIRAALGSRGRESTRVRTELGEPLLEIVAHFGQEIFHYQRVEVRVDHFAHAEPWSVEIIGTHSVRSACQAVAGRAEKRGRRGERGSGETYSSRCASYRRRCPTDGKSSSRSRYPTLYGAPDRRWQSIA